MTSRRDDSFSSALRRKWTLATGVALSFFAFALGVGFYGVPFGSHWDEWYAQRGTEKSLQRLDLFPGDFTYNGLYFDLAFLPLVDDVVDHLPAIFDELARAPTRPLEPEKYPAIAAMQKELTPLPATDAYVHEVRRLFCGLTLLMVLFVFLAARALWPLYPSAAVVAAAVAATSWELGYHARYIAVDALMASLAALMFWCIFEARRADAVLRPVLAQALWAVAAVAGGLALGGKVTGLFYCVPIGLGALLSPPRLLWAAPSFATGLGWWRRSFLRVVDDVAHTGWLRVRRCLFTAVVFSATALLSTPGMVRDPVRFAAGIYHTAATYNQGKFAYATHELGDHLEKLYGWLALESTAPFLAAGVALSMLAMVGAVHLARRRTAEAAILLSFFVCWSGVLLRAQQLSVRNALALLPVVILCIAAGVVVVAGRSVRVRAVVTVVLVAVFASSAAFDVYAARSIRTTTRQSIRADAVAWLNDHADRPLVVGPRLHAAVGAQLASRYSCRVERRAPTEGARVALFFDEHDRFKWQSNTIGFYEKQFSSLETNLERYANWRGRHRVNRISVLSVENAVKNKMKMRRWFLCTPASTSASTSTSTSTSTPQTTTTTTTATTSEPENPKPTERLERDELEAPEPRDQDEPGE